MKSKLVQYFVVMWVGLLVISVVKGNESQVVTSTTEAECRTGVVWLMGDDITPSSEVVLNDKPLTCHR